MGSEVQLTGKSRPLLGWVGDILFVLTQLVEDLHGHWCRGTSTTSDLQACGGEDEAPGICVMCEKVFRARYSLSSSVCVYIHASSDQGRCREDLKIQDAYSRVGHDRGRTS